MDGGQGGLVPTRVFPRQPRFVDLPFIVPKVPKIKTGAAVFRIGLQSGVKGKDALETVRETPLRRLAAGRGKVRFGSLQISFERGIVSQKVKTHGPSVRHACFSNVSRSAVFQRAVCLSLTPLSNKGFQQID